MISANDFEGIFSAEQCISHPWTREMLREELESPLSLCVTERREKIAGFALGRVVADEGELFRIAVLPEYRRRGIAEKLLLELHKAMAERGAAVCFLEVRSKNAPAISLYEKVGYERISLRKGYYGDDDAVIMRIDLK